MTQVIDAALLNDADNALQRIERESKALAALRGFLGEVASVQTLIAERGAELAQTQAESDRLAMANADAVKMLAEVKAAADALKAAAKDDAAKILAAADIDAANVRSQARSDAAAMIGRARKDAADIATAAQTVRDQRDAASAELASMQGAISAANAELDRINAVIAEARARLGG